MTDAPKIPSADSAAAQHALRVGAALVGLDPADLWATSACPDAYQHNTLADAVNEKLIGSRHEYRVPYLLGTYPTR